MDFKVGDPVKVNNGQEGVIVEVHPKHVLIDVGNKDGYLVAAKWRVKKK